EERRQQQLEWEKQRQMNPNIPMRRRTVRIPDSFAVLIAGFADFKAASDFLPAVNALEMPKLTPASGKEAFDLVTYQERDPKTHKMVIKRIRVNPFETAMVVRNPLILNSAPAKPKWDPIWKKLNEDEEYSLLRNPKPLTLLVKVYTGG